MPNILPFAFLASVLASPGDSLRAPGLHFPVEILRDSSGIAHIRARDEHDLFFAQGWNAARDRLFQLELWRRQATGTMAEALGPRWAARDRAARLFAFRGDMTRELASYHPHGAAIVQAFVDGVNARVAQVERDPSLLPPELRRLGVRPGRWTSAVVVSRHNALASNAEQEIDLARAVRAMGVDAVRAVGTFEPDPVVLAPDSAIDVDALSDSVLAPYRLWRAPVSFVAGELVAAAPVPDEQRDGSNNWVVAGTRTASGKPLLANDPHRTIQVPSLRYWVHLTAPGWDVVGAGEPALPGVSVGHNRAGAWGLTIFGLDMEDVYVYRTDPTDARRYRYRTGWERMREIRDTIRVRGAAPQVVVLRFTRHGPVVMEDPARHLAYALRAAWLEPGTAPYLASLRLDQARTWAEFHAGAVRHLMPAENLIWADTGGTIAWQAAGIAPVRHGWTGLVPVPGDGRYEWSGFLPIAELPHVVNPPNGFVATANENNVPAGYARVDAVGRGGWADPWRVDRVREVLDTTRHATAVAMAALQHDELALPARALVPLLRALAPSDPTARWARDTLLAWDRVLAASSVPAAVYVAWERQLLRRLHERAVPAAARSYLRAVPVSRAVGWLTRPASAPTGVFGGGAGLTAARDSLLAAALTAALGDLRTRLGPDPQRWRYGQPAYHHALIRHPLSGALDEESRGALDVGPAPRGGYASTVNATGNTDNQTHGASFRLVADLADWDASLGTNTPGQSGDPRDPHYRDLFGAWAVGHYFHVPYTSGAVERAAESRTVLAPK
ncbi:peptidase S45 penicillin amidase [Gemmatirosa kalamazoonensis]|uniref:Peptidase S45 penicillin amidase n=1 Tax=Gemmatirosa kalamazoonensis TaxID=861299 RepID=W0RE75_9BACT|nr:penicillin acylase family protein [Gemmatirosa kalamazoonensis]AHG89116.1 peptidase S45 penicillin amidase [Gemmatirosa kalamazoonensis]